MDWACGSGRHALFLAHRGMRVTGIDRDPEALARAAASAGHSAGVTWVRADLASYPIPGRAFDAVLVFHYLDRERLPDIRAAVRSGGLLFFETFLVWQRSLGWGPTDDAHLLQAGEILELVAPFEILHAREAVEVLPTGARAVGSIVARRPATP